MFLFKKYLSNNIETLLQLLFIITRFQRNTQRIGNLITDLLNSSRPTEMQMSPMALHPFWEGVLEHCKDRMKLKGFELIDEIKADEAYKNVPLIMITAMDKHVLDTTKHSADAVLPKPFKSKELLDQVKELLAN